MRKFIFEKRKYGFELLMDLHRFENNPNVFFDPKPHTTDFFEIMIFEKANGVIELNGHLIEIADNSFFFISPFQTKSCKISLNELKGFHLVFQSDFLSDFFNDALFTYRLQYFYNTQYPQYLCLQNADFNIIKIAFNEIITEINNYQNDSTHILRSLLYFSLSKLNRLYSNFYHISPDTQSNTVIYRFKALLEQNIRKLHTVADYCNLLKVTRHQLNTLAKEYTKHTTREIINNRLLLEIKTELRYSNKTIAEISDDLHFSEPNNLTRFFQKLTGTNPTTYRKNYQNDRF
ncbi:AraC family transcriptional regulator [Aquimarina sp. LLG6339-5]|uniref:AraC family transcriptional regulator n=1 Tax=Aquimarina sp. LLG6339-5 TaxID=3160830 RepID=UPI003869C784